jgi:hypothetical protein
MDNRVAGGLMAPLLRLLASTRPGDPSRLGIDTFGEHQ